MTSHLNPMPFGWRDCKIWHVINDCSGPYNVSLWAEIDRFVRAICIYSSSRNLQLQYACCDLIDSRIVSCRELILQQRWDWPSTRPLHPLSNFMKCLSTAKPSSLVRGRSYSLASMWSICNGLPPPCLQLSWALFHKTQWELPRYPGCDSQARVLSVQDCNQYVYSGANVWLLSKSLAIPTCAVALTRSLMLRQSNIGPF